MDFSLKRLWAVFVARLREFYRDTASWAWNLLMPVLVLAGFAFIFQGDEKPLFTLALIGAPDAIELPLLKENFIQLIEVPEGRVDQALRKLQRHQYDLLLDVTRQPPRYWINTLSERGRVLEQLLLKSPVKAAVGGFQRGEVEGQDLRYVDWVMPGVLAMNMRIEDGQPTDLAPWTGHRGALEAGRSAPGYRQAAA